MKHLVKLLFQMLKTQRFILQKMAYTADGEAKQEIRGYRDRLEEVWGEFNSRLEDEEAQLPGVRQWDGGEEKGRE